MVFVDVRTLLEANRIMLFRRPLRSKRIPWWLGVQALFGVVSTSMAVGRGLDHLLTPGFRKQRVEKPIFIIANPRSGTTLLHNLMCLDDRYTHFKLFQTIFPSTTWYRVFGALQRLDERIGHRMLPYLQRLEQRAFGGWDDVHPMGFNRSEEDEAVFFWTVLTAGFYLFMPFIEELPSLRFGDELPKRKRRRLMHFYKETVKRHLFATGPDKTLLSKNVLSCGRLRETYRAFPDARFIYLVRDPADAVPSFVSMFYKAWRVLVPEIRERSDETHALAQFCLDLYAHVDRMRQHIPESQFLTIQYRDLVADPKAAVEKIYDYFDLGMDEGFEGRLAEATASARKFHSRHDYSLESFGLSRDDIDRELHRRKLDLFQ